ncbi:hypothetical protein A2U01_0041179, partial [Trifolium medium]|nr:hypothetical protein [Trifolium medium]
MQSISDRLSCRICRVAGLTDDGLGGWVDSVFAASLHSQRWSIEEDLMVEMVLNM